MCCNNGHCYYIEIRERREFISKCLIIDEIVFTKSGGSMDEPNGSVSINNHQVSNSKKLDSIIAKGIWQQSKLSIRRSINIIQMYEYLQLRYDQVCRAPCGTFDINHERQLVFKERISV